MFRAGRLHRKVNLRAPLTGNRTDDIVAFTNGNAAQSVRQICQFRSLPRRHAHFRLDARGGDGAMFGKFCRREKSFFGTTFSSSTEPTPPERQKRLDVAIVGLPNAGKSQLLNVLTQSTIAAVSRKSHTTRSGILGVKTIGDSQLVFVDTPGFLTRMDKDLADATRIEMEAADYTLLVIDAAKRIDEDIKHMLIILMLRAIQSQGRWSEDHEDVEAMDGDQNKRAKKEKFAIVLNKVDLVSPKTKLLEIATDIGLLADLCVKCSDQQQQQQQHSNKDVFEKMKGVSTDPEELKKMFFDGMTGEEVRTLQARCPPVFFISALHDDGIDDMIRYLIQCATLGEWEIPDRGAVTQMSDLERVEEIIREKLYRCLHREVPHSVDQVNRIFHKIPSKEDDRVIVAVRIDQDLVVTTKSHVRLVSGHNGLILKRISDQATKDLKVLFRCNTVQLSLHIKLSQKK